MNILGISAYYHDSAACLVQDGKIAAAAQEERFTRKKHDDRFPENAVEFCPAQGGIEAVDVDLVTFYDKPLLKFDRLLETYITYAPTGFKMFLMGMPLWLRQKLHTPRELDRGLKRGPCPAGCGEGLAASCQLLRADGGRRARGGGDAGAYQLPESRLS